MNPAQPPRKTDNTILVATGVGVVVGLVTFTVGFKSGFKLKSLVQEVTAYQLIVTNLRDANPDFVDDVITSSIENMNGVLAAANP